ncbi:hypothetical protein O7632_08360 [Solwaraspora sp. WMMD406]|uniref:hypothetical protein n=1 Tax=Solwaraspora sp. WMMD406 TaxID=3016095 RepID=UPI0024176916|nr:hypothetical protein [Solwaraspora sp. WMMD406]MDG4764117.1 hypothetical protein [Solwaraspora sp. WMMD406]
MSQHDVVTAQVPESPPEQPAARFALKLALLAAGGALVGLAITLALGGDEPFAGGSWGRTLLLLAAVTVAAGVGALIHRTIASPGQIRHRAAARLEEVSSQLDSALRQAGASLTGTGGSPAVQAHVDAVSNKLDGFSTELESLMRNVNSVEAKLASANRTAWATFFLGTLVGLVSQVTLG